MVTDNSSTRFLSDSALLQIDAKQFREKIGITKADYRFVRNLRLRGIYVEDITIYSQSKKQLTLHQFIKELRDIDVLYITRMQKERHDNS